MPRGPVSLAAFAVLSLLIPAGPLAAQEDLEPVIQGWGIRDFQSGSAFAHHPESQRLATAHRGGALLWDTASGLTVREFPSAGSERPSVHSLDFSPDGTQLLIAGDSCMRLHDVQSGAVLVNFAVDWSELSSAIFSPDGHHVAAVQGDRSIAIWDAASGGRRHTLEGHPFARSNLGRVINLRFSPDGTTLLSGGEDCQAILWDVETGDVVQRFFTPTKVGATAFRDDGKQVLTMGTGGIWNSTHLIVWDVESGRPLRSFSPYAPCAWFVGDEIHLLQLNGERERISPERQSLPPISETPPPSNYHRLNRTAVSQDHWRLRIQGTSPVAALQSPSGEVISLPNAQFDAVRQEPLDFSPDQRWLATGGGRDWGDNKIVVWDLGNGRQAGEFIPGELARFDPDSQRLLISGLGQMSLFDIQSGEVVQTYESSKASFTSLQFVAGGKQILAPTGNWYDGDGGQILLWDTESGELLHDYATSDKAVLHARMTPDETKIVASLTYGDTGAGGIDQILLFDIESGEALHEIKTPSHGFMGGLHDPAGKVIIGRNYRDTRGVNNTPWLRGVLLWNLETLKLAHRIPFGLGAFSRDGGVLSNFNPPDRLSFWDTATGKSLTSRSIRLRSPEQSIFHPGGALYVGSAAEWDARSLGLGSASGIGFWEIASGERLATLYTFQDDPDRQAAQDWLITTSTGAFSGSEGGLARIAWRARGTDQVSLQPARTNARVEEKAVGEILSRSLPPGVGLRESLAALSVPPVQAPKPRPPRVADIFQTGRINHERAIQAFQDAGARTEMSKFSPYAIMVHMEGYAISDELIAYIPWIRYVSRLYLADTGITDEQLKSIAMMGSVERMSLWGNPITDAGMAHLETLWSLKVLDIHDTAVTAEGLNQLRFLDNLETLIVPKNVDLEKITLRERLPNLEIILR